MFGRGFESLRVHEITYRKLNVCLTYGFFVITKGEKALNQIHTSTQLMIN